jgi:hypothetical protein
MCKCGVPSLLLTVSKEGPNQGREFWRCPNGQSVGDCQFFEWYDEPPRQTGGTSGSGGGGASDGSCFKVGVKFSWLSFDLIKRRHSVVSKGIGQIVSTSFIVNLLLFHVDGMELRLSKPE